MEKKTEYLLLYAKSQIELTKKVNDCLGCGWMLYGTPFESENCGYTGFNQAVIKEEILRNDIGTPHV